MQPAAEPAQPVAVTPQPTPAAVVEPIAVEPAVQETVGFADDDQLRVHETVVDEPISFAPSAGAASANDTALYPGFAAEVAALRVAQDEAADAEVVDVEEAGSADQQDAVAVLVATTTELPGHRILTVVGPVVGVAVRRHADLSVGSDAAQLLTETRQDALSRLSAAASAAGATGVIGLEFKEGSFADLLEIAVYGTGVIAERE